jgi:hypothetical protein
MDQPFEFCLFISSNFPVIELKPKELTVLAAPNSFTEYTKVLSLETVKKLGFTTFSVEFLKLKSPVLVLKS